MDIYIQGQAKEAEMLQSLMNPMAHEAGLSLHIQGEGEANLSWDQNKYYLKKNNKIKSIERPCSLAKLLSDIQKWGASEHNYQTPDWVYDPIAKVISAPNTEPQELRDKEADILMYFIKNPSRIITKEELLSKVWGYKSGMNTRTIETHIYRLRQKLEQITSETYLMTETGGYLFKLI